jgi:protein arginine kinase activator
LKEGVFTTQKNSLFDDIFSSFSDLLGFEQVENVVCPVCKTTLKEFKTSGKLGCPNCYDMFREEISNIIKRIAPFETHKQEMIKTKPIKAEKFQKTIDNPTKK